jgi:hypothetical protein
MSVLTKYVQNRYKLEGCMYKDGLRRSQLSSAHTIWVSIELAFQYLIMEEG